MNSEAPDRNLAIELARVTEAAALAAARWQGRADKEAGDQAAVDAMRHVLDTIAMTGTVVIGEGEKDLAPMLFNGEQVGAGGSPEVDIAVDPVEGTTLLAEGRPGAIAVIAASPAGTMFDPGPCFYMEKLVVGADAVDVVDLDRPLADNLAAVADATGREVRDLTVAMLDRPRHADAKVSVRNSGARLQLIDHGDVDAGIQAAWAERPEIDVLYGIGGTPEGVITAAAIKSFGGEILGRLWPRDDQERRAALDAGYDLDQVLRAEDLITSDDCSFAATGITPGQLIPGVTFVAGGARTVTLIARSKSGTVRVMDATHRLHKLSTYSAVTY